jgi:riboflavin kinase
VFSEEAGYFPANRLPFIDLERKSWIQRNTPDGSLIKIEEEGTKELQKLHSELKVLMEKSYPPSVTLEGTVFTGLGEGAYYVTKEHYRQQIVEKLGFEPYPGTLNLKLSSDYDIKTVRNWTHHCRS